MIKRASLSAGVLIAALLSIRAQDIKLSISGGSIPVLAVPELRASGDAQRYMTTLNQTLWEDLAGSGMFKMAAKTMYPTAIPQQPQDFRQNQIAAGTAQGSRMADWSGPPVSADSVAFGFSAVQNGLFVLYGWMFDLRRDTPSAQVIGNRYPATLDEAGGAKSAQQYIPALLFSVGGGP